MTVIAFIEALAADAAAARDAEATFRREAAARIALLANERAFAFRRLALVRATADAVAGAEDEAVAVAAALAALRARLGWGEDSEARSAVLSRFAAVAAALYAATDPVRDGGTADVAAALAGFEGWYAEAYGVPFWALFEHEIPETPRVDF